MGWVGLWVLNATFNNILIISWRQILLTEGNRKGGVIVILLALSVVDHVFEPLIRSDLIRSALIRSDQRLFNLVFVAS